jgi:hypothetical protein
VRAGWEERSGGPTTGAAAILDSNPLADVIGTLSWRNPNVPVYESTIICHHASLYIGLDLTTLITDAVGVIELS